MRPDECECVSSVSGRARAPTRSQRTRERTSHGPRSATRRTRVDRAGPSARPRAARVLATGLLDVVHTSFGRLMGREHVNCV